MISKLYEKCIVWAKHKHANKVLAAEAFIESSFFPIPPDVMIVPMVVAKRKEFIKIATIATLFSVLGAIFGYFIGYIFFNEIGVKIFEFYGYENTNIFKEKFSSKGSFFSWIGILFAAGFTPLPFKVLTISSGFINFNFIFFIIICMFTRGLRFFLVSFLAYKYGNKIGPFLEKKGNMWSLIITVIIIVIAGVVYFKFYR